MAFDWQTFFQRYNIEHGEQRRGWLWCYCPWCGGPGTHHLGVSIKSGGYHCWHGHSGISAQRLVVALLGCSQQEAGRIVGSATTNYVRTDESFADESFRRLGMVIKQAATINHGGVSLLPEFAPISDSGLCRLLALPYLKSRHYDLDDSLWLAERYQLRFAANGVFAYRIIVPVIMDKQVVTWTGRTVAKSEELRYKSLTTDLDKARAQGLAAASCNIKDTLLDWDNVRRGGEVLVVTEGPFDALRVGFFGERYGIRSTCLFGVTPTLRQLDLLNVVRDRYDEVVALFDRDAAFDSFRTVPDDPLQVKAMRLPEGVGDPAELTERQFWNIFG